MDKVEDTARQEASLLEIDVMAPPESGSGGYRPAPGLPGGYTPFPKPRDIEGEIPDEIKLGAEILIGFTPAGVAIDFKDLAIAIEENDPVLAIAAGIGFIPVVGDLFKVPYKMGRASAKQAKYLKKLEKELGSDGIDQIRKKTSDTTQAAAKASRVIRVLEPKIILDANDDFRRAVYPIVVDGHDYVVTLVKRSYGAPVQVSFNVPGAEGFPMTGLGKVWRVYEGTLDTVKDFSKRFPNEKSFSFSGAVQGGPRPTPGEATKRARAFSTMFKRKMSRDPELAAMVKGVRDASRHGDANTWKIDLHELRRIIKEEINFLPKRNNSIILETGANRLHVEVANTPKARNQGLMYRTILGEDCGMLFAFPASEVQSFWMKNTPLPLSIAFINESGNITNIEELQPFCLGSVYSSRPVKFALEMKQGWFKENDVKPGDNIRGLPSNPLN